MVHVVWRGGGWGGMVRDGMGSLGALPGSGAVITGLDLLWFAVLGRSLRLSPKELSFV